MRAWNFALLSVLLVDGCGGDSSGTPNNDANPGNDTLGMVESGGTSDGTGGDDTMPGAETPVGDDTAPGVDGTLMDGTLTDGTLTDGPASDGTPGVDSTDVGGGLETSAEGGTDVRADGGSDTAADVPEAYIPVPCVPTGPIASIELIPSPDVTSRDDAGHSNCNFGALFVSEDGNTFVGSCALDTSTGATPRMFRWTAAGGSVPLPVPTVPGTLQSVSIESLSADVSVIGGVAETVTHTDAGDFSQKFEFVYPYGSLGPVKPLDFGASGVFVNAAGTTYATTSFNSTLMYNEPYLYGQGTWTPSVPAYVYGISGDGNVVVGAGVVGASTVSVAFRAVRGGTVSALPVGTGAALGSSARAANRDGSIIVGTKKATAAMTYTGFRWTAAGSMDIGQFTPQQLSEDGAIVVGTGPAPGTPTSDVPQVWTAAGGTKLLSDFLKPGGGCATAWNFDNSTQLASLSRSGKVLIGQARYHTDDAGAGDLRWYRITLK